MTETNPSNPATNSSAIGAGLALTAAYMAANPDRATREQEQHMNALIARVRAPKAEQAVANLGGAQ